MKAILTHTERQTPIYSDHKSFNVDTSTIQEFTIQGDYARFDVRMVSNGDFIIPPNCDIEVEMIFKFTPREPESVTVLLQ